MQAGDNPSQPNRQQPDGQHVKRQQHQKHADLVVADTHGRHQQQDRDQVADQGREENRDGHDFRRKYRLGNQIRLVEQAGRGALDRFAEQQPGQHAGEDIQSVAGHPLRRLHPEAELEDERPAQQQNQGMNQAPDPAHGGADKPLLEIPADQLKQ